MGFVDGLSEAEFGGGDGGIRTADDGLADEGRDIGLTEYGCR